MTRQKLMDTRWRGIHTEREHLGPDLFTSQVYQEVVAGKSRHNGALAALECFAVSDAPALVDEYAERKQQKVIALIQAGECKAFPDGVRLLLDAHTAGVRVAAASSSRDANLMLGKLRLDEVAGQCGMATTGSSRGSPCSTCSTSTSRAGRSKGQAAPGDLLDRLPRGRRRGAVLFRRQGRRLRR